MKKVFIEGSDHRIATMFKQEGWSVVVSIFDADLLCLEGGEDVTPSIYKEANTHSNSNLAKDHESFGLLALADNVLNIPVVGICRGSQVMCVYNGGKMTQHIHGHGIAGTHGLDFEGETYQVSSVHHQESVPSVDERFIWRADDGCVEMVLYEDKRMFGFQPHPEYHQKGHSCRELFFKMLDRIME